VPNGPPDLDAVVAHAARIVGVPAEQRQVVLDELACVKRTAGSFAICSRRRWRAATIGYRRLPVC
jgi:hypothetical protein